MEKLGIDLETLNSTISVYQESIDELERILQTLHRVVEDLPKKCWDSAAGEKCCQKKQIWEENLRKHIILMNHLCECLNVAKDEYSVVYDNINSIGDVI